MNKLLLTLIALLTVVTAAGIAPTAFAQQKYTALEPLPCYPSAPTKDANGVDIKGTGVICTAQELKEGRTQFNFSDYVQFIFNLVIAISASAAVFMIVYGGFQYMTTDSWSGKSEGLGKLKGALLGLLLVLTSYMILRTVNPALVAIPTTLVTPLEIKYDPLKKSEALSLLDNFEKILDSSTANITAENKQILADVAVIRSNVTTLQTEQNTLCEQLRSKVLTEHPGSILPADCTELTQFIGDLYPTETQRLHVIENQIHDNVVSAALKKGAGVMNASIIQCNAGQDFETCQRNILAVRTKYNLELSTLTNDPTVKTKLDDYARYAAIMAYANSQVASVVKNSEVTGIGSAFSEIMTKGSAAIGTVAGLTISPVGAIIGGTVGARTNEVGIGEKIMSSLKLTEVSGYTGPAVNNITTYSTRVLATITDPALKAVAQKQLDEVITALKAPTPKK